MEKPPKTDRVIGADLIRPISETPQIFSFAAKVRRLPGLQFDIFLIQFYSINIGETACAKVFPANPANDLRSTGDLERSTREWKSKTGFGQVGLVPFLALQLLWSGHKPLCKIWPPDLCWPLQAKPLVVTPNASRGGLLVWWPMSGGS